MKWVKLPPKLYCTRALVKPLACSVNYIERGMIKCINSEFGSSGQSNVPAHCKACQIGRSEQQVLL